MSVNFWSFGAVALGVLILNCFYIVGHLVPNLDLLVETTWGRYLALFQLGIGHHLAFTLWDCLGSRIGGLGLGLRVVEMSCRARSCCRLVNSRRLLIL